ncbi:phosphotransferase [Cellulomonas fimi]|uniref:Phosphotransferase n=1 Tax=Cellulomonas fimi TaxID=1708 RepID=A0A7Y0QHJ0_CELFI|nr:phosphotransferase [Cellulomonas fimi]NMR21211.1 phosphotransferase [Cellulomonas fimi]
MTTHGATDADGGPGPLLAAGGSADIYLLDDDRLLRRNHEGVQADVAREARLLRHVVAHGFPAPEVFEADHRDLVMERLHGPSLLQALAAGELSVKDGADIMADLHARLHAVPAPEGTPEGDVVVHLDVHPGNIVLSESHGPALIDWTHARTGPPDLDIAVSAVILGEVAADSEGDYSRAARAMLAAFLAVTHGDPVAQLDAAVQARLADPSLVSEERALVEPAAELVRHYAPEGLIGDGAR